MFPDITAHQEKGQTPRYRHCIDWGIFVAFKHKRLLAIDKRIHIFCKECRFIDQVQEYYSPLYCVHVDLDPVMKGQLRRNLLESEQFALFNQRESRP